LNLKSIAGDKGQSDPGTCQARGEDDGKTMQEQVLSRVRVGGEDRDAVVDGRAGVGRTSVRWRLRQGPQRRGRQRQDRDRTGAGRSRRRRRRRVQRGDGVDGRRRRRGGPDSRRTAPALQRPVRRHVVVGRRHVLDVVGRYHHELAPSRRRANRPDAVPDGRVRRRAHAHPFHRSLLSAIRSSIHHAICIIIYTVPCPGRLDARGYQQRLTKRRRVLRSRIEPPLFVND